MGFVARRRLSRAATLHLEQLLAHGLRPALAVEQRLRRPLQGRHHEPAEPLEAVPGGPRLGPLMGEQQVRPEPVDLRLQPLEVGDRIVDGADDAEARGIDELDPLGERRPRGHKLWCGGDLLEVVEPVVEAVADVVDGLLPVAARCIGPTNRHRERSTDVPAAVASRWTMSQCPLSTSMAAVAPIESMPTPCLPARFGPDADIVAATTTSG